MKRILIALLALFATFLAADASAAKKKPRAKPTATVEREAGDADRDRGLIRSNAKPSRKQVGPPDIPPGQAKKAIRIGAPVERQLQKSRGKVFDLRSLPRTKPKERERPELEAPEIAPVQLQAAVPPETSALSAPLVPQPNAAAPPPSIVFEGLDREFWGAGSPPDTNGDAGPTYYIQSVNSSVGIYRKSDGFQEAAFTFDTLMSQGNFGNLCDTENFGDPVVLYDTFEDRWILTDFAFLTDGGGNPVTPAFQCFAVSMTGNPLTGGWNFYSTQVNDALNDYPKLGIWTDGLYMSANMFGFGAGGPFRTARAWAFNKAQMYAGSPTVKVVSFDISGGDFTVVPSNARLQSGTPPPGRPNLFLSSWLFTNALTVYKFHVDWNSLSSSTFTGPDTPIAATSWPNAAVANAPQPGTATLLDVLQIRAMVQNQYTNYGGVESLWVPHTVRRGNTTGFAAPRWYQVNVTGGSVNLAIPQAATWDPDAANVVHRYMPSLALDRAGNMAMGYTTSNATTEFPSMKYAGRLAGDAANTFSQTEQTLFAGTASQTTTTRWGDYSAMTLDPNGCTFWFTSEYANPAAQTFDKRWKTKIGSFSYPSCTAVGAGGTITGTVTLTPGGTSIAGATVQLGARSATTDGSGVYSFLNIPAGTYPTISATKPGYSTATASSLVVTDGGTTTQDFSLTAAPASACMTDTTQADFLTGVATTVDLNTTPGSVTLLNTAVDQQNTAGTTTGTGFGATAWTGQTFIPSVTGQLVAGEVQLFCNGCGATPPDLTLSVRATAAGLPTGADLATTTISGALYASGSTVVVNASFGSPATVTAATQYALILRPVSAPAGSGYFWIRASPSSYANGSRVLTANSGATWTADTTRDFNFKVTIKGPYVPTSGNLVSGTKDSNGLTGLTPIWSSASWNGSTPANTTLQFQVAGSNNPGGPFTFVGPDGTAGTFFTTSPGSLTPLYNLRYAKYKAYLATTNNAVTPTLDDVTMCVTNTDCSGVAATITPAAQACTNSTGNTASGPAGMTSYSWGIANGTITSATNIQTITYTAGASGNVALTLSVVSPAGCQASGNTSVPIISVATPTASNTGPYCEGNTIQLSTPTVGGATYAWTGPNGFTSALQNPTRSSVTVADAGSYSVVGSMSGCDSAAGSTTVVINATPATPVATNTGAYCDSGAGVTVQLNTAAVVGATYAWTGPTGFTSAAQNPTRAAATPADSGLYSVTVTDTVSGCTSAAGSTTVGIFATPATPIITPGGPTTFCTGGSVTLTSSSATGNQWYLAGNPIGGETNNTYVATAGGNYTVIVTTSGCSSAASAATVVTVNPIPATPTITPGGPTTFCPGGSVTLTSSSASGNQWYLNGNPIGGETNTTYAATASGNYTVIVTTTGCSSAASGATSVTVNPTPATPTITPGGPTTFCTGGSVTLTSSSASGNQWYLNGNPIGGQIAQQYVATASGNYTVDVTASGCTSAPSSATTVTVNPIPATPTITPGGPTTFCAGGSVTLTSSSASGNQWSLNGNPIGGATNTTYAATASGNYTVVVTTSGCSSAASAATVVTVNPIPATPTITPGGPTMFCSGGSVTLTSSSASGNQWYVNGSPIGGATAQQYIASAAGDYTVVVTTSGCSSSPSATTTVTVNVIPNAAISAPATVASGSPGNTASVASAGVGATYNWLITNGTITAGTGTPNITFTAGAVGSMNLQVTVAANGCSDAKSANVIVGQPAITVTSVVPSSGKTTGGKDVTISGTGFQSGATVTFGGAAATSVVVVNATTITAKTPAHAAGAVNVVVTNPDTSSATRTNGYTFILVQFDPNNDGVIDPADIFYLVNYLFLSGPPPAGPSGLPSGDANNDGVVDPADIFYLINYLFLSGPMPASEPSGVQSQSVTVPISGAVTLGEPVRRGNRYVIPVIVSAAPGSSAPQALSLHVVFKGSAVRGASVRRLAAGQPSFEISRSSANALTYLLAYEQSAGSVAGVVAEIEIDARSNSPFVVEVDPVRTLLTNQAGTSAATVARGTLRVTGTTIDPSHTVRKKNQE